MSKNIFTLYTKERKSRLLFNLLMLNKKVKILDTVDIVRDDTTCDIVGALVYVEGPKLLIDTFCKLSYKVIKNGIRTRVKVQENKIVC